MSEREPVRTETETAATPRRAQAPAQSPAARVLELQRQIGNRAAAQLLQRRGYEYWATTPHWNSSRDQAHSDAKAKLIAADADLSITKKLYGKHNNLKHGGKLVTSFKTSAGGYLVVVTYADLTKGGLTYDTAFLSKNPAAAPEKTAKTFNPQAPVIPV